MPHARCRFGTHDVSTKSEHKTAQGLQNKSANKVPSGLQRTFRMRPRRRHLIYAYIYIYIRLVHFYVNVYNIIYNLYLIYIV